MADENRIAGKIILGTILALLSVGFAWQLTMAQSPSVDPPDWSNNAPLYHNKHPGWEVWVQQEQGNIRTGVTYDRSAHEGIQAYVAANNQLASNLFADSERWVPVEVTFNRPVEIDAFRNLIAQANIKVERYEFRGFEENGQAVTVGGGPIDDVLVPKNKLQELAERAAQRGRPYELAGVYLVVGKINRGGYEILSAADEVFLIDVTKPVAQQEITQATNLTILAHEINVISPYTALESLGLVRTGANIP